jgi:hypothetical protein
VEKMGGKGAIENKKKKRFIVNINNLPNLV